jgi:hypothetical protein
MKSRAPFAHVAVLSFDPADDERAPGAAITVELCGSADHEPPCPVAPHHTAAHRAGDELHLRVLFAADPAREAEVRRRIESALAARWPVVSAGAAAIASDEADHAERLTRTCSRAGSG